MPETRRKRNRDVERSLRERLRELNCLHEISRLAERYRGSLDPILQGIVDLLPSSWQYPEACCAKLTVYDKQYTTGNCPVSGKILWRR